MTDEIPAWLREGQGIAPKLRWSFTADAPLSCFDLVRETGDTVVADASGGLYRLDRLGHVASMTRGFHKIRAISWSDTGDAGVIVLGESNVCRLSRTMEVDWTIELPDTIRCVATNSHGKYTTVCMTDAGNVTFDARRSKVGAFESVRPLSFVSLLVTEPTIVGAAEYGLVCRHQLDGTPVWNEKNWTNVGALATSGNGNAILLAGFNRGILVFDGNGTHRTTYVVDGSVNRLATSFHGDRIVASTLENHLFWLDSDGELLWATQLPEEVAGLACDPFGEWIICGMADGRLFRLDWS